MDNKTFELVKEMTEAQGTSGFEGEIRDLLEKKMAPYVDHISRDGLGGIFGIKKSRIPNAPRVMVAAHMDEVGFMLSQIKENGLFSVLPLGGWNPYVVSAQRFTLHTSKGDKIPAVSSSVPPHLLRGTNGQTQVKVEDILFDAGFESKSEAESYGLRPGDMLVPDVETVLTANHKSIISKAWDNRYGCTIVIEVLEALKDVELPFTLIAGANVQEEVGLRGAKGSTYKFDPALEFIVDCSAADDINMSRDAFGRLGEGFLMRIYDPTMITLPAMRNFLIEVAEENRIPYQYFVSKGGTDAGVAHTSRCGVPSAVIGVCGRYIHTHQTLFRISDYMAAKDMLLTTLKTLTPEKIAEIRGGDMDD